MEEKLGLLKGAQITPNMIDRAKILAKKYFDDKGFKNADIQMVQRDDVAQKNQVILDVIIDKKEKMKVRTITIEGNKRSSRQDIKGGIFRKGAFAKTHEAGKLATFLKVEEVYTRALERRQAEPHRQVQRVRATAMPYILSDSGMERRRQARQHAREGRRRQEVLRTQHSMGGQHRYTAPTISLPCSA